MKRMIIAATLALTATAGAASAQTPGHAQLAEFLNLNGAEFSTAELTAIDDARRDNNRSNEIYFLNHNNRDTAGGVGDVTPGKAQIAAQLGVDPAKYSLAELIEATDELRDDNRQNATFVLNGTSRDAVNVVPTPDRGRDS
ncbi:hypothetical protein ERN12_08770 [Rhodobacteraceae bacterium]|nr:hypothetical protein ERN12_08770 [Paracoccaceae bacterium]